MSQPEEQKTVLLEIKDTVAKNRGFRDYTDLIANGNGLCCCDEVAESYASQQTASLQKQVEELDELLDEANAVRMCHADHEALLLKRMSVLEIALKKIANPIAYLKQEAEKEGGQLNGYAYELSNNASWLKTIAKEALEALNPQDNAKEAHS